MTALLTPQKITNSVGRKHRLPTSPPSCGHFSIENLEFLKMVHEITIFKSFKYKIKEEQHFKRYHRCDAHLCNARRAMGAMHLFGELDSQSKGINDSKC